MSIAGNFSTFYLDVSIYVIPKEINKILVTYILIYERFLLILPC